MVDLSRNAVMTVDQLEHFFVLCSKMGLNSCMLYMEDTYQIPDYPYFGYCRGAYSLEELKALDAFAETVGIELIPCIQTLAHLTNPLKWGFANGMRDTSDILLVEEEKTYQFLDRAISVIAAAFKTSKIHIGMDEAHDLGRGHYLTQHGLIDRFDIMEKHLKKVMEICRNYQLQPMMWSDMFFRIGSKSGDYYDKDVHFPEDLIAKKNTNCIFQIIKNCNDRSFLRAVSGRGMVLHQIMENHLKRQELVFLSQKRKKSTKFMLLYGAMIVLKHRSSQVC